MHAIQAYASVPAWGVDRTCWFACVKHPSAHAAVRTSAVGYEIRLAQERLGTPWPTLAPGLSTFVQTPRDSGVKAAELAREPENAEGQPPFGVRTYRTLYEKPARVQAARSSSPIPRYGPGEAQTSRACGPQA